MIKGFDKTSPVLLMSGRTYCKGKGVHRGSIQHIVITFVHIVHMVTSA